MPLYFYILNLWPLLQPSQSRCEKLRVDKKFGVFTQFAFSHHALTAVSFPSSSKCFMDFIALCFVPHAINYPVLFCMFDMFESKVLNC